MAINKHITRFIRGIVISVGVLLVVFPIWVFNLLLAWVLSEVSPLLVFMYTTLMAIPWIVFCFYVLGFIAEKTIQQWVN